jgi:homoserine dehydrogenase
MVAGLEFQEAVLNAQRNGYAEADPSFDINGTDAAQKLILLARLAFGVSLPLRSVAREGIERIATADLHAVHNHGVRIRLIATCQRTAHGFEARVALAELPQSHPLASVTGAQNRMLVELISGETFVSSGSGAGRWPTTEAVIADLIDICRERFAERKPITQTEEECVA